MPTIETTWDVWTYDVWGNAEDGYDVNDRSCIARDLSIPAVVKTHECIINDSTPHVIESAEITESHIRNALGIKPKWPIDVDGDDVSLYVACGKTGRPLGELNCTSNSSISPIRQTI